MGLGVGVGILGGKCGDTGKCGDNLGVVESGVKCMDSLVVLWG